MSTGLVLSQPALAVTVAEAAQLLRLSRSKAYALIARGEIRTIRIGGSRRVPLSALTDYVERLMREQEEETQM